MQLLLFRTNTCWQNCTCTLYQGYFLWNYVHMFCMHWSEYDLIQALNSVLDGFNIVLDQNHLYKKGLRKEKDFIAMDGCPLHTSLEACLAQFL